MSEPIHPAQENVDHPSETECHNGANPGATDVRQENAKSNSPSVIALTFVEERLDIVKVIPDQSGTTHSHDQSKPNGKAPNPATQAADQTHY
ncbi:hypothetical protein [Tropicibacter sp. Alg240-R139]|uniref:hypothetical protein n=1 Tax=Tropicibacter sp. Alg240-R139 TaxID=2305991 RepID=UPI0013DF504A|nr:hypothetical protein [Tropicibacter sp. Alg240-R139]